MPYALMKVSGGYYVYNKDTGKKYSQEPMPLERAKRQLRALYLHSPDKKQ